MAATSLRLVPVILAIALLSGCLAGELVHEPAPRALGAPKAGPFAISGGLEVALSPGSGGPLNLTLTNPGGDHMVVTRSVATVTAVDAPEAGPDRAPRPTSRSSSSAVRRRSASPRRRRRAWASWGSRPERCPPCGCSDTDVNRDGCRNATLTLAYTGTAKAPR